MRETEKTGAIDDNDKKSGSTDLAKIEFNDMRVVCNKPYIYLNYIHLEFNFSLSFFL